MPITNPADFALIFGTPVPGYQAQPDVTGPAAGRSTMVALTVYSDAVAAGVGPVAIVDDTSVRDGSAFRLSRGTRLPRLPRRLLGKSLHFWADHLGLIGALLDSWRGRTHRGVLLIGTSLRQLVRRHGVALVGRTIDADGRTVRFDDGQQRAVDAVVWATGYRSDYTWINVPVFDAHRTPIHLLGQGRRSLHRRPSAHLARPSTPQSPSAMTRSGVFHRVAVAGDACRASQRPVECDAQVLLMCV